MSISDFIRAIATIGFLGLSLVTIICALSVYYFLAERLREIQNQQNKIMSKLTDGLTALETKVDKITGEVTGLRRDFDDLKGALDEVPPEADAILDRIAGKLDAIDALNPDKPANP